MTEHPAGDELFALIASIPGSGTVDWCGPARALLDRIRDEAAARHVTANLEAANRAQQEIERLRAALAEMTHCRDNALRALNRDDVDTDPHLPDLFADGLHGLYEWEDQPQPDQAPQELVDRCVQIAQPAFGKLTQQRDAARTELAKYVGTSGETEAGR